MSGEHYGAPLGIHLMCNVLHICLQCITVVWCITVVIRCISFSALQWLIVAVVLVVARLATLSDSLPIALQPFRKLIQQSSGWVQILVPRESQRNSRNWKAFCLANFRNEAPSLKWVGTKIKNTQTLKLLTKFIFNDLSRIFWSPFSKLLSWSLFTWFHFSWLPFSWSPFEA